MAVRHTINGILDYACRMCPASGVEDVPDIKMPKAKVVGHGKRGTEHGAAQLHLLTPSYLSHRTLSLFVSDEIRKSMSYLWVVAPPPPNPPATRDIGDARAHGSECASRSAFVRMCPRAQIQQTVLAESCS